MRSLHPPVFALALALALASAPAPAHADDKVTFTLSLPKGASYKTQTVVSVVSRMQMPAGGAAGPAAPAPGPAPSAAVGMSSSCTAATEAVYRVESAGSGGQIVQVALAPVRVRQVPDMGSAAGQPAPPIDPSLKLAVSGSGAMQVLGAQELAARQKGKDGAPNGAMPAELQQEFIRARFALCVFWMPKAAVGVGDEWEVKGPFPLRELPSAPPQITGKCKLVGRDGGIARLEMSGSARGTLAVDEKTGWLISCDLSFTPSSEAAGGPMQVTGRIIQKTVK